MEEQLDWQATLDALMGWIGRRVAVGIGVADVGIVLAQIEGRLQADEHLERVVQLHVLEFGGRGENDGQPAGL